MNELKGSCHCGNVEFSPFTEKSPDKLHTTQVLLLNVQKAWRQLHFGSQCTAPCG